MMGDGFFPGQPCLFYFFLKKTRKRISVTSGPKRRDCKCGISHSPKLPPLFCFAVVVFSVPPPPLTLGPLGSPLLSQGLEEGSKAKRPKYQSYERNTTRLQ